MKQTLIRLLIREVIEASASSSATPSTDTAPSSPEKDRDDGGNAANEQPEVAVEKFISNTKNSTDVKQQEEIKKLASSLKKSGISDETSVMGTLKNLERDEPGGPDLAKKIVDAQKSIT